MQALSGAGKGLGMLGAAGQMAVGAITGTVGAFSQITAFAGSFVQAFNPALMEQMNLVFKDLTAVIGMGLEPVIGAVIPIVRAFADKLVPVMQAMIPTVQLFADSMIQLAGPIIEILIQAFAALEPIIVMAAGIVEMWAGVLTWAVPLIAAVIKEVVYWFTKIVSTVQYVVGSLMIAIGKVLAMIPGTGNAGKDLQKVGENAIESSKKASKATDDYYNGTSKVQKAIQKPMVKGASVGAAAGKASFSGISDLGRNLMQSAMSSSTQASAIRTAENTQKTVEVLTKMDERMSRVPMPDPAAPARAVRRV
jgi:phage-related protein